MDFQLNRSKIFLPFFSATIALLNTSTATQAAEEFFKEGIAAYNRGDFQSALGQFGAAQPEHQEDPTYHYYMANTYVRLNLKPEAIREYKIAKDLQPNGPVAKLCATALQSLTNSDTKPAAAQKPASASKATASGASTAAAAKWQLPQLVLFVCDSSQCERAESSIMRIYPGIAPRIDLVRIKQSTTNPKQLALIKRLKLTNCPTVLLLDDQGKVVKEYAENISTQQMIDDIVTLVPKEMQLKFANPQQAELARTKAQMITDAYTQLGRADQDRRANIAKIEQEQRTIDRSQERIGRRMYDEETATAVKVQVAQDAEQKKKALDADFAKQRDLLFANIESRLDAMRSSRAFAQ